VKRLPQPFNIIHPQRVKLLINQLILWVLFQLAQRFMAFGDDIVTDNERIFYPSVCRLQIFKQTNK
jgi:hypothetical protein